jgi:ribonuclease HI
MQFYVDGSVDPEDGRSAAAYTCHTTSPVIDKGVRITDHVSSTQAELSAVHLSLLHILSAKTPPKKTVIFCDSQAAILTLKRFKPDPLDQLAIDIIKTFISLTAFPNFHLTFHWIPSHIGIPGNERADRIANKARASQIIEYTVPGSMGQCKSAIRAFFTNKTINTFSESKHPYIQRYLKVNPCLKSPNLPSTDPIVQVWFNRLRLNSDQYCYIHKCCTLCYYCKSRFTPQHYLSECPVTAFLTFAHILSQSEHNLTPFYQHAIILQKASRPKSLDIFSKYILKTPPKIQCSNTNHGIITLN